MNYDSISTTPSARIRDRASEELIVAELKKQSKEGRMESSALVTRFEDMRKIGKFHQDPELLIALAGNPEILSAYLTLIEQPAPLSTSGTKIEISPLKLPEELTRIGETVEWVSFPAQHQLDASLSQAFSAYPLDQIATKETYAHIEVERSLAAPEVLAAPGILAAIYYELGHALGAAKRLPEAASAFQSAVREDPRSADLRLHLAQAFVSLDNYQEALRAVLEAVLLEPASAPQALSTSISWLTKLNDRGRSLGDWLEGDWLMRLDREAPGLRNELTVQQFLGLASLYRADYGRARGYFEAALRLKPDDLSIQEWYGETLLRLGEAQAAQEVLQSAYEQALPGADTTRCVGIGLKLARAWIDLDQPQQGIELLQRCQAGATHDLTSLGRPFALEYHLALAEAYLRSGDAEQALGEVVQVLKIQPGQIEALALTAESYLELEQVEEAEQLVEEVLRVDPQCLQANWVNARLLAQSNEDTDWKVAIYKLREYLQRRPRHAAAQRLLVALLKKDQRPDQEVISALQAAIDQLGPSQAVDMEWELVDRLVAAEGGQLSSQALQELEQMVAQDPAQQTADWWLLKGQALEGLGELETALASYQEGLKLWPVHLGLLEAQAHLLNRLEHYEQAAAAWEQVAQSQPGWGYPRFYQAVALMHSAELIGKQSSKQSSKQSDKQSDKQHEAYLTAYESLQKAFEAGFGTNNELELEACDLRVRLAELGQLAPETVAQHSLEAGKYYYWEARYEEAIERFERARGLVPELAEAYWYLSESQRLLSFLPSPPYVDTARAQASLQAWQEGYALTSLNADNAWILVSRAFLAEQLVKLPGFDPLQEYWQAVALLERKLLWGENDLTWLALARLHRLLSNESTSLYSARMAREKYPENRGAIEELVAILANIGEYDEALSLINEMGDLSPADWLYAIKAFIMLNQAENENQLRPVLELLSSLVQYDPNNLWYLGMRGSAYRRLKDYEHALGDYQVIWERRLDANYNLRGNEHSFGWAGMMLGMIGPQFEPTYLEEARQWMEKILPAILKPGYLLGDLAMCHLALGDIEQGTALLDESIGSVINVREVADLVEALEEFSEYALRWPQAEQVRAILAERLPLAQARREVVLELPHAINELYQVYQETLPVEAPPGEGVPQGEGGEQPSAAPLTWRASYHQWANLAANLGLARMGMENDLWREALGVYIELMGDAFADEWYRTLIDEVSLGAEKSFLGFQAQSDKRFMDGERQAAIDGYDYLIGVFKATTEAIKILAGGEDSQMEQFWDISYLDPARHAELLMRYGYFKFVSGDQASSRELFDQARQFYLKRGLPQVGQKMGEDLAPFISRIEDFWLLEEDWQAWMEDTQTSAEIKAVLGEARQALLAANLGGAYNLTRKPIALLVTPLRIWLEPSLVPADPQQFWPLADQYLPEMRERLRDQMGIDLPVPQLDQLPGWEPGSFVISINDIPSLFDQVPADKIYCRVGEGEFAEKLPGSGMSPEELMPRNHPLTGEPGYWVPAAWRDRLLSLGMDALLDGAQFIAVCLEAVLLQNLGTLFGVQESEALLKEWENDPNLAQTIDESLTKPGERVAFAILMRNLVAARVPLTRPKMILETFKQAVIENQTFEQVEHTLRLKLRLFLPGNQAEAVRRKLPAEIEASMLNRLYQVGGRPILAAPYANEVEVWMKTLRELGNLLDSRTTLVVENPQLRPALEYLLDWISPAWTSLTAEEHYELGRQMGGLEQDQPAMEN